MYPDWPESDADLVPLPRCHGPKLKPFDFQGPQKIEFLDYIGEGLHAHVFKIKIMGKIYALKLFRFVYDGDWMSPDYEGLYATASLEAMSAFYEYSEPFSSECRAFGRLQEAGHEELAVRCFGYLLLDEQHERAITDQFSHHRIRFNGNVDGPLASDELRSRFLGKSGRLPPIRGIVKEFGHLPQALRTRDARRILQHVTQLHQLGIIYVDVADRQLINHKICDFSTAITTPHYVTNPELNPLIAPEWIPAMEFETFQFSISDYWSFDDMVQLWNAEHKDQKSKLAVYAFPGSRGYPTKYNLRNTPSRERVFSFVDPRLYDWRRPAASPGNKATRASDRQRKRKMGSRRADPKTRVRLDAKPPKWYLDCNDQVTANLKLGTAGRGWTTSLRWEFRDGRIFPRKK
ncbi:uncharacterized protein G6M90_00g079300 [Metarhizium brunneum]|uniref:Protein kinase domain-containing protein n=1 Tax=Metarhizium brunneum TaxID=500148 RepID=A0A7D5ZAQ0_9HYPO|nr:hypothetical protein G6M90_00g079300 [Metarhizium brunneum]